MAEGGVGLKPQLSLDERLWEEEWWGRGRGTFKPQLSVDGRLREKEWCGCGRGSFKIPIKCGWEAEGEGVVWLREG